ncbi:uroporphyrinogen decarboxylase family protein [Maledivibacter halophilus]|uniref:Uroporphyrinogen decarboxylase n=1 Tax=Maledivibacter halophilus TaxID=36842 RepID=A0A1T5LML6_9FIRM|nr:uroporphyrinogen decarboxylase family protein [Maledivibacter halophilus]SKC77095.1 uroporphyrinogen decarboxylase [Maledivibacter halophilus]
MQPKERLFKTLKGEPVDRVAWVPFAGVHSGFLKGYAADEVLQDADKLYESLMEVNRLYKPDGQPVIFDLQLEAECLGCELQWEKNSPPSIKTHPLDGDEEEPPVIPCECTIPTPESGRFPIVLDVMRRMKESVGDTTALYGLITGPFTLASHLRGNNIFTDMFDFDEETEELLNYCSKVAKATAGYMIDAGMDVIAVVDPLISQISSNHFEEYMTKPFTEVFDYIRERGAYSSFFVCGDATRNLEVMCETKPDSMSIDENVDLQVALEIGRKHGVVVGGNIPLTTVMLNGNQMDNMKFVVDLLDNMEDKSGFILAPGCDMPYATPIDNAIGVAQAVIETDSVREMVKNYVGEEIDTSGVVIPDYENLDKPLMEVFTLDPLSCAACTYMFRVAQEAKDAFGDKIDMVEYRITEKENIARVKKMEVKKLPSIYINGELEFSSIIPSKSKLEDALNAAMK